MLDSALVPRRTIAASAAVFAVSAVLASAPDARAESISELVPRLIEQGGWLRAHYPGQLDTDEIARAERAHVPSAVPTALLGSEPHVAIVARDWREAYSLTDGRPLLFDRVRLIRSSRMAVTRVSWAGGKLLPYAEVSFGQWRADTDLVPWLKSDAEIAGQVAVGAELSVAPRCAFAWDLEETHIYASGQDVPTTRLMASFAAVRAEF